MIIHLHRGQMRWFRHKAKLAYPLETLALLIGKRTAPQSIGISYFVYPKLTQSKDRVSIADTSTYETACELALEDGVHVVGTIHSHCDALPIMSRIDKNNHRACGDWVSGILTVLQSGKTALEFWQAGDCLALTVEYYK